MPKNEAAELPEPDRAICTVVDLTRTELMLHKAAYTTPEPVSIQFRANSRKSAEIIMLIRRWGHPTSIKYDMVSAPPGVCHGSDRISNEHLRAGTKQVSNPIVPYVRVSG
jgi:hypothetical protein